MGIIKLQRGLYEGRDVGYSQYFGQNPQWYAPFGLKGHNGIDIPLKTGTKLLSCINGTVTETANDRTGYGIYIKIENEYCGVLYGHLKEFSLKVGDVVKAGDFIGYSGNTGNSTGPHLHFGVFPKPRNRNNGYAGYIDPLKAPVEWVDSINSSSNLSSCEEELKYEKAEKEKYKMEARALRKEVDNLNTKLSDKDKTITNLTKTIERQNTEIVTLKKKLLDIERIIKLWTK